MEIDKADSHIHTTTTTTTGGISPQTSPLRDTHSKGKVTLRILSLFFGVLQSVANERRSQHKPFRYITIHEMLGLQLVAGKCTKVGNEQPSKQPLGRSSDFQFTFDGVLPAFINEVAVLVAVLPFNLLEYRHLPTALISVQFRTSEVLSNWWPFSPIW